MPLSNPLVRIRLYLPVALAVAATVLATAAAAQATTRQVSPLGRDAGNCVSAPCATLRHAYEQSAAGDVVNVAAGVYSAQEVPGGSKAVTFRGAFGNKIRELDNNANNVTFDGIVVDAVFAKTAGFENHGASNVTFRNGSIGNVIDEKGALVSGSRFTFDNVLFHDVIVTDPQVHNECVYAIGVPGFTVRNSRFFSCATMDLFFTYGDWWSPKPPAYGNITVENNVFGHTTMDTPGDWHYYSMVIGNTGSETLHNWVIRYNTFEITVAAEYSSSTGSRWVGNLGDWDCVPGFRYSHNVGKRCGSSDKSVNPPKSTRTKVAPFGWVNPLQRDFRLRPGSPAINAGDPSDAPATDGDGLRRDNRPDAGAHEFGASGASTLPPGRALRIMRARLKPRVICVRPRKHCRGSSKLRFRVSRSSRLSIKIKRVGRKGKLRRVRSWGIDVPARKATRIRAARLGRGRYRVVLRAHAGGASSPRKVLKLRVR
jgi:hypothetical protein